MKSLKEMTFEEKMLRHIICGMRDVIIGGFENTYADCGEEQAEECWPLKDRTKENVVNDILSQIFDGKESYVVSPIDFNGLEKKHIKFMGKAFVKELIEDRVEYDYQHEGWNFPNNYSGDLK